MKALLYEKIKTVILTSATLSTNGHFDYIRSRLGLPGHALEGIYPSHFDFKSQALLYVPKDIPDPRDPGYGPAVTDRIGEILLRTQGRGLVLFTSYHNLNRVYQVLEGQMPFRLYKQGDAPRSVLLDAFRQEIHSVLMATSAFWQGVDVPGEALSCLIIDKLPFDSPGDPLVAARIETIRDHGGNPFTEYQLPSAIIALKQGLGRLVRKRTDRGILAVLDSRVMKSRYGHFFLESLPDVPITHDLSDIACFLGGAANRAIPEG
jgi:ATP-dependent DNA helicase DinG